jgi:hypothetical protein
VILQASILIVCPMLASLLTHFCIAKLSCGVGGRMIFEGFVDGVCPGG